MNPDLAAIVSEMRDRVSANERTIAGWANRIESALHSQAQEREGWVLVNKAELQAALENVKVPKMSQLKQELFKAGTHAVIRAFNAVIFKAAAPTGGSEP